MNKKNIRLIISTILILTIILLLCIFTPFWNVLTSWVGNIFSPMQAGASNMFISTKGTFLGWQNTKTLAQENELLQKQVDELTSKNREYLMYKQENDRLRELLGVKNQLTDYNPVAAGVISKNQGSWFDIFTVNKGSGDKIAVNSPVVSEKGLIGRVSQTGSNWAKVVTVIDSTHSVSGMISRTNDLVQIDGDLSLMQDGLCKMTIITEGTEVVVGDEVFTSGIGGIYPKGLFVGTVTEFRSNNDGVGKYAVVKPAVDFKHIFDVVLLTQVGEE